MHGASKVSFLVPTQGRQVRLFDHTRITRTDTILQLSHALNLDIDIDRQEHKDRLRTDFVRS